MSNVYYILSLRPVNSPKDAASPEYAGYRGAYNSLMAGAGDKMTAVYATGERGAREASREGAAVVVVDAFRASTTIAVLVRKGARVIPVALSRRRRSTLAQTTVSGSAAA